jgi:hypothetical protein
LKFYVILNGAVPVWTTGEVKTLSFANFSRALVASKVPALVGAGTGPQEADAASSASPLGDTTTVDYSKQPLSVSEDRRQQIGEALGKVCPPPPPLHDVFGGQGLSEISVADLAAVARIADEPHPSW